MISSIALLLLSRPLSADEHVAEGSVRTDEMELALLVTVGKECHGSPIEINAGNGTILGVIFVGNGE